MDATVSIRKQESCEKAESDIKALLALSLFGTSLPPPGPELPLLKERMN